jgi:hypothetical protein
MLTANGRAGMPARRSKKAGSMDYAAARILAAIDPVTGR